MIRPAERIVATTRFLSQLGNRASAYVLKRISIDPEELRVQLERSL